MKRQNILAIVAGILFIIPGIASTMLFLNSYGREENDAGVAGDIGAMIILLGLGGGLVLYGIFSKEKKGVTETQG